MYTHTYIHYIYIHTHASFQANTLKRLTETYIKKAYPSINYKALY